MAKDVFILGGKRTPMGEYAGALKDISANDLRKSLEITSSNVGFLAHRETEVFRTISRFS